MSANTIPDIPSPTLSASTSSSLSAVRLRLPRHVVYRSYPSETVVLDLNTGRCHGLAASAGRMLDALARTPRVSDAAAAVAIEGDRPEADARQELCDLCRRLLERGLIEIEDGA